MTTAILDNEQHLDIKVDTRATREFGDMVNRSIAVSSEFNDIHKDFPILLHKDSGSGEFTAHVILGFEKDENLFVENERWISRHVPASLARGPFSLGYVRREDNGEEAADIKVMIDEDDPRIGTEGQAVFLQLGGESPYLEHVKRVLQLVDAGLRMDKVFYPQLMEMDLLEEVKITITLNEEQQYSFAGYYTISQDRLAALNAEQLLKLSQSGTLGLVYFLVSSLGNLQKLIKLKSAPGRSA
jgi:hypothetical protein